MSGISKQACKKNIKWQISCSSMLGAAYLYTHQCKSSETAVRSQMNIYISKTLTWQCLELGYPSWQQIHTACFLPYLPSHFSRICTVSPISRGRPHGTSPLKLASTNTTQTQRKHPEGSISRAPNLHADGSAREPGSLVWQSQHILIHTPSHVHLHQCAFMWRSDI